MMINKFLPNVKIMAALVAGFVATLNTDASIVTISHGTDSISIEFVDIGYAGNAADGTGYGAVDYEYSIGKFEVTADQWNAVISADSNVGNGGGWSGSQPTARANWYEAAKFCNWLTSGNALHGAYKFSDTVTFIGVDRSDALSNYDKVYVLPTEDEWYKAAYLKRDGSGYTLYPTGDNAPIVGVDAKYTDTYGQPWNVGSGKEENNGTYDMGGNIWEWCEDALDGQLDVQGERCVARGGNYRSQGIDLQALYRSSTYADWEGEPTAKNGYRYSSHIGFRVAILGAAVSDRDNDGVPDDEDLFPDDPNRSNIIDHIEYIIAYVSDDQIIFDSDWKKKNDRDAFINKLEAVLELVTAAEAAEDPEEATMLYILAAKKVDKDLIKKANRWLVTQEAQDLIIPDLEFLSEYLWMQVP